MRSVRKKSYRPIPLTIACMYLLMAPLPAWAQGLSGMLLNQVNPPSRSADSSEVERSSEESGWNLSPTQIDVLSALSDTEAGRTLMQALQGDSNIPIGQLLSAAMDVFGTIPAGILGPDRQGIIPFGMVDGACSVDEAENLNLDFSGIAASLSGYYEIPGEVKVTCPEGTAFRLMTSQAIPARPIGVLSGLLYQAGYDVWIGDVTHDMARITLISNGQPISSQEFIANSGEMSVPFIARLHGVGDINGAPNGQGAVKGLSGFEKLVIVAK